MCNLHRLEPHGEPALSAIPDYRTYSLEQLHDVVRNINRELYPERYALALRELREREEEAGIGDDESFFKKGGSDDAAERLRRARPTLIGAAALLGLSAVYGIMIAIDNLRGMEDITSNALVLAVGAIGIVAAILIGRGSRAGILLGLIAGVGETIRFESPTLDYSFHNILDSFARLNLMIGNGTVMLGINPIGVIILIVIIVSLNNAAQRR